MLFQEFIYVGHPVPQFMQIKEKGARNHLSAERTPPPQFPEMIIRRGLVNVQNDTIRMKSMSTVQKDVLSGLGPLADRALVHSERMFGTMLPLEKIYEHLDLRGRLKWALVVGYCPFRVVCNEDRDVSRTIRIYPLDGFVYVFRFGVPSFIRKTTSEGFRVFWGPWSPDATGWPRYSYQFGVMKLPFGHVAFPHECLNLIGKRHRRFDRVLVEHAAHEAGRQYRNRFILENPTPGASMIKAVFREKQDTYLANIDLDEQKSRFVQFIVFLVGGILLPCLILGTPCLKYAMEWLVISRYIS